MHVGEGVVKWIWWVISSTSYCKETDSILVPQSRRNNSTMKNSTFSAFISVKHVRIILLYKATNFLNIDFPKFQNKRLNIIYNRTSDFSQILQSNAYRRPSGQKNMKKI